MTRRSYTPDPLDDAALHLAEVFSHGHGSDAPAQRLDFHFMQYPDVAAILEDLSILEVLPEGGEPGGKVIPFERPTATRQQDPEVAKAA